MNAVGLLLIAMRLLAPQASAAVRLQAFVDALNTGKKDAVKSYLMRAFKPELATDDFAGRIVQLARIGIPVHLGKVLTDQATIAIAEVRASNGDPYEIKMTFEVGEPYRATSVLIGGPGSQSKPPKQVDHWKDLTDLLQQIKEDSGVPALGIAVSANGKIESAVVGKRDVNQLDAAMLTDRWLIGSITKSMTATMIARLVDSGVLKWDTTIGQIFPRMPMREEYRDITLLQLLQHRSGVQQDRYVTSAFLNPAAGPVTEFTKMRDHYAQFTLNRPPLFTPGTKMAYSNAGYSIAGHMAEVATGKPYETLMRELVFDPLGMSSARFGVPGSPGNPGARGQLNGHVVANAGPQTRVMDEPQLVGIQAPAGLGMGTTLEDLLKFAQFHLAGLRRTQTLVSAKNFAVLHDPADKSPGAYKYACGWVIEDALTPDTFHGHNGSDGTFYAEIAIWPKRNLAAVSITNIGSKESPSPPLQAILSVYRQIIK